MGRSETQDTAKCICEHKGVWFYTLKVGAYHMIPKMCTLWNAVWWQDCGSFHVTCTIDSVWWYVQFCAIGHFTFTGRHCTQKCELCAKSWKKSLCIFSLTVKSVQNLWKIWLCIFFLCWWLSLTAADGSQFLLLYWRLSWCTQLLYKLFFQWVNKQTIFISASLGAHN